MRFLKPFQTPKQGCFFFSLWVLQWLFPCVLAVGLMKKFCFSPSSPFAFYWSRFFFCGGLGGFWITPPPPCVGFPPVWAFFTFFVPPFVAVPAAVFFPSFFSLVFFPPPFVVLTLLALVPPGVRSVYHLTVRPVFLSLFCFPQSLHMVGWASHQKPKNTK